MADQGRMRTKARSRAMISGVAIAIAVAGMAAFEWLAAPSPAIAEDSITPPSADAPPQELPPPPGAEEMPFSSGPDTTGFPAQPATPGRTFIAEIVDSSYFVGPAEFFALDLPATTRGARAIHLFGDVQVQGGKGRDVIVRLFRSKDYQDWLKKRAGKDGRPLWISSRSRNIHIDQALPPGVPVVLLLDNGYSIRTPKQVRVQIQIQFDESGAVAAAAEAPAPEAVPAEGEIIPRGNTSDDVPPPPPPPPPSDGSN